jgi:cytoskeleton protein RodZ
MEKLGQLLKTEREKRGLSLHEIGMSLKINPKILKAIEDSETKNLPAKTFLRGFVRSYTQYLRLDVEYALKLFQTEYGPTRPEELKSSDLAVKPADGDSPELVATTKPNAPVSRFEKPLKKNEDIALPQTSSNRWLQIFVAIFILVSIAFVVKMIDKYQKESEIQKENLPVASPIEATTSTLALAVDDTLSTPVSTAVPQGPVSSVSITTTSTLAASPSSTSNTTTTMKPTTTTTLKLAIVPTTVTSTTVKGTTTTMKPTTTTTVPASTTTTLVQKNIEVIVEALNTVQIKYTLGEDGPKNMELKPDQVHTFKSRTKVQLEINDGGAINVIVNGRDKGVPGTIGKSIKLSYP